MNQKIKYYCLFLLFSGVSLGQNPANKAPKTIQTNKIQFGVFFSSSNFASDPNKKYNSPYSNNYKRSLNNRYGITFDFMIGLKLSLSTGFLLDVVKTSYDESIYRGWRNINVGVQIPVLLNYRLTQNQLAPFVNFGLIQGNRSYTREEFHNNYNGYNAHSVNTTWGLGYVQSYYSNLRAGFGLDAQFKKCNIKVFPFYELSVSYTTNGLKQYYLQHFVGGAINVSYGF